MIAYCKALWIIYYFIEDIKDKFNYLCARSSRILCSMHKEVTGATHVQHLAMCMCLGLMKLTLVYKNKYRSLKECALQAF